MSKKVLNATEKRAVVRKALPITDYMGTTRGHDKGRCPWCRKWDVLVQDGPDIARCESCGKVADVVDLYAYRNHMDWQMALSKLYDWILFGERVRHPEHTPTMWAK